MKRLFLAVALAVIVQGCAKPELISVPFPPAIDVEGAVEPKPVPTAAILESEAASLAYDNEVEAHGERVLSAAVRVCLWLNRNGGEYDCGG